MPNLVLRIVFDAAKNVVKTGFGGLWSVAIVGHSASWSLVIAKGQGGSGWELVTPCAQSTVVDPLAIHHYPEV